jgi:hypothetical protein
MMGLRAIITQQEEHLYSFHRSPQCKMHKTYGMVCLRRSPSGPSGVKEFGLGTAVCCSPPSVYSPCMSHYIGQSRCIGFHLVAGALVPSADAHTARLHPATACVRASSRTHVHPVYDDASDHGKGAVSLKTCSVRWLRAPLVWKASCSSTVPPSPIQQLPSHSRVKQHYGGSRKLTA